MMHSLAAGRAAPELSRRQGSFQVAASESGPTGSFFNDDVVIPW